MHALQHVRRESVQMCEPHTHTVRHPSYLESSPSSFEKLLVFLSLQRERNHDNREVMRDAIISRVRLIRWGGCIRTTVVSGGEEEWEELIIRWMQRQWKGDVDRRWGHFDGGWNLEICWAGAIHSCRIILHAWCLRLTLTLAWDPSARDTHRHDGGSSRRTATVPGHRRRSWSGRTRTRTARTARSGLLQLESIESQIRYAAPR